MHSTLRNVEEKLRFHLGLRYHLVGVKLMKSESGIKGLSEPEMPMAFCQMVRRTSTKGETFVYGLNYERCPTAQGVLGFREFKHVNVDHKVAPPETRRVLLSPLDELSYVPDVVLAVLTPRQMMDLIVIVQDGKNAPLLAELTGEHACAEFFAKPYVEGKPNMSLLCKGAREIYSDFRDDEVIFGAPFNTYVEAAEAIERIAKMRGALCGCRTSDVPTEILKEFERAGFSKGTDYFFGKVKGHNIRVYLNKDLDGRLKFITIHLPMKMPSEEVAEKLTERLRKSMPTTYSVDMRSNWLDLTVRAGEDELGIDLFDGLSVKAAIEKFIEKVAPYIVEMEKSGLNG